MAILCLSTHTIRSVFDDYLFKLWVCICSCIFIVQENFEYKFDLLENISKSQQFLCKYECYCHDVYAALEIPWNSHRFGICAIFIFYFYSFLDGKRLIFILLNAFITHFPLTTTLVQFRFCLHYFAVNISFNN